MKNTNFQGWFLTMLNKTLSNNRDYYYKISQQSDRIIVWLVGFSITGIAFVVSKGTQLDSFINNLTNYIIICGSLTVIFGVLYRIFLYFAQSLEIRILIGFEGYIEAYNNASDLHFGREITDQDTYNDIIEYINADFGVDAERIDITHLDLKQVEVLRKSVLDYYLSLNNWENQKLEKEKDEIKKVLSSQLGYSKKKVDTMFDPKEPKIRQTSIYWFSLYASSALFVMSCLAFTSGIFMILIEYLK